MSLYFLMCSERCGSNFITRLMNAHSKICGPATKHLLNPVARNLFRYEPISVESHWTALLEDIERLLNAHFSVWQSYFDIGTLRELATTGDIVSLLRNIFLKEARASGKEHCFIKENQLYEFLPFLLNRFPDARYVFQTRDPRDMALSWKKNPDHPGGLIKGAQRWQQDQQKFMMCHNELRISGRSVHVRYEDLIEQPEQEMAKLLNHLGHSYEAGVLNFHEDKLTRQNSDLQKAWGNLGKEIIRDNKAKYRDQLTSTEIAYIERICRYEMTLLGYIPETSSDRLDALEMDEVDEFGRHENHTIPPVRSHGVIENMHAKQVFYQKVLKKPDTE